MKKRILLLSHNLNIEGAPTMLVGAAKILEENGYSVELLSMQDGPYRKTLERWGISVKLLVKDLDISKVRRNENKYIQQFDLIIANTILGFPLIAEYNNTVPIMWYLHEGKTIQKLFSKNYKNIFL